MRLKGKFVVTGLALAMLLGAQEGSYDTVAMAAPASAAVTESSTQFAQDIQSIQQQERHDYMYVMKFENPMMKMTSEGTLSFKSTPSFQLMGNMKTQTIGIDKKEKVALAPFYMKETDKGLVFYARQEDGTWTKQTSDKSADLAMLHGNFEQKLGTELIRSEKAATLLQSNENSNVYKLTVNGTSLLKNLPMFKSVRNNVGMNSKMVNDVLENIGDVDVFLGIDRKKHNISVLKADLSQPIQNGFRAAAAQNGTTGIQPAALNALTNNMTVVLELTSADSSVLGNIAIPAEVEKNAVEAAKK